MDDEVIEVTPISVYDEQHFRSSRRHDPEDDDLQGEAAEFSIGEFMDAVKRKGIKGALNDERLGPHAHLIMLLFMVFIIAIIVSLVTLTN